MFLNCFLLKNPTIFHCFILNYSSLGLSEGDPDTVEFADWVDNAATVVENLGSKETRIDIFVGRRYQYEIDLNNPINVTCPLTILNGHPSRNYINELTFKSN